MADPSAEFSPAELDDLEDALELLEGNAAAVAAPHVRRRLDDYRNILTLSRSAMPMVSIPTGLLEGVLAQARASVEVPTIAPTPVVAPARPSLWARMRMFALLPGVALAGTAAVVLLMVDREPKLDVVASPASSTVEVVAQAPAGGQPVDRQKQAEGSARFGAEQGAAAVTSTPAQPAAAAPRLESPPPSPTTKNVDAPAEEEDQADIGIGGDEEKSRKVEELSKGKADGKPGSVDSDQPAPATDPDMPRWDIIARGDRARHRGDCRVARNEYALALADADGRVRARAHAGLGLCDGAEGDRTSADAAYRAARELDPEIASFIDDERPRAGSGASSVKAAKSKPKAKTADAFDGL